jgi:hypothetical protein
VLSLSLAIAGLAVAVAACGGTPAPTPTATPTVAPATTAATTPAATTPAATTPAASPTEGPTSGSAPIGGAVAALSDVDSYRFAVELTGADALTGGSMPSGDISMRGTVVVRPERALDFTLSTAGLEAHYVLVGGDAWLGLGTGALAKVPGGAENAEATFDSLKPERLLGGYTSDLTGLTLVGSETRNGVAVDHYEADAATAAAIASRVGGEGFTVDAWLAQDGDYLVAFDMQGTVTTSGSAQPFGMKVDISGIDDPANRIERPS